MRFPNAEEIPAIVEINIIILLLFYGIYKFLK